VAKQRSNLGLALEEHGILAKYNVEVLGTPVSVIRDTEDRELFIARLNEIGVRPLAAAPRLISMTHAQPQIEIGYPIMIRAGFALGGEGSGLVRNERNSKKSLRRSLVRSLKFWWKNISQDGRRWSTSGARSSRQLHHGVQYGKYRSDGNPYGRIDSGGAIANAFNAEYHSLREIATRTIRHLGIVGECNIQYALDPKTSDYRVIEVNARLSRSSALAIEGHRLSARIRRGQARPWLHVAGIEKFDHEEDNRVL